MPISREEFDAGHLDLSLPIRRLLQGSSETAFTLEEVQELFERATGRTVSLDQETQALDRLVAQEQMERTEIDGEPYYVIIRRRIGFRWR